MSEYLWRGGSSPKPRPFYKIDQYDELDQELKGLQALVEARLDSVRTSFPTAVHGSAGNALRLRLEAILKNTHRAREAARDLKYDDHPMEGWS